MHPCYLSRQCPRTGVEEKFGIAGARPEVEDGNAIVRLAEEGQRRVIHQNSAVQISAQPRQVLRRQAGMLNTSPTLPKHA